VNYKSAPVDVETVGIFVYLSLKQT